MAFNLYFAGIQCKEAHQYINDNNCLRLMSYANDRTYIEKRTKKGLNTFIDCGAYSAFTRGKIIDIDEYLKFLNTHKDTSYPSTSLDVIPKGRDQNQINEGAVKSWENYLYMRGRLDNPESLLPVFHYGEDFKFLTQILNYQPRVNYMAFGGLVFATTKERSKWIAKCFEVIKASENPFIKVHAFGMTNLKLLERYPLYSADSTSWLMTGANGGIMTKWGVIKVSEKGKNNPNHIIYQPKEAIEILKQELNSYNISFEKAMVDYKVRMICNIAYMKNWADNYQYKPIKDIQMKLF